ncbi:DUF3006 domain-containing protein [Bacillus massiliglaciei]|uniref:DUF3006 domain-containing protein n=1 Tax=Bacillus massiliglaciei TaxID=1816693 RepID=UPI000DA6019D|nr:DUF3006 domain-containing protein [Bacillus massiliglaciei]
MKKGMIDRFEGDMAVIEFEKEMKDIPRKLLPPDANFGDVLLFDGDDIKISKKETEKAKKELDELIKELFEE